MKAALPRCARCGAFPHAIDLGAGHCFDRPRADSCLWQRALRKWRLPRARQVVARIESKPPRAAWMLPRNEAPKELPL